MFFSLIFISFYVPVIEPNNNFSFDIVIVSYDFKCAGLYALHLHFASSFFFFHSFFIFFLIFLHLFQSDKLLLIFQSKRNSIFSYKIYRDQVHFEHGQFLLTLFHFMAISNVGSTKEYLCFRRRRNVFHKICHVTMLQLCYILCVLTLIIDTASQGIRLEYCIFLRNKVHKHQTSTCEKSRLTS